jgi:hypothetical protein
MLLTPDQAEVNRYFCVAFRNRNAEQRALDEW